jgi:hypothetical protein
MAESFLSADISFRRFILAKGPEIKRRPHEDIVGLLSFAKVEMFFSE